MLCTLSYKCQVLELLEHHPQCINYVNPSSRTPLYVAAWKGHVSVVRLLLEHGADINRSMHNMSWNSGATPLSMAAAYGRAEVVQLLAEAGADIDHAIEDLELLLEDGVKLGLILWCWGGADSSSVRTAC